MGVRRCARSGKLHGRRAIVGSPSGRIPDAGKIDDQHPDQLAVMQGPPAPFAVGDRFLPLERLHLSSVRQTAA